MKMKILFVVVYTDSLKLSRYRNYAVTTYFEFGAPDRNNCLSNKRLTKYCFYYVT